MHKLFLLTCLSVVALPALAQAPVDTRPQGFSLGVSVHSAGMTWDIDGMRSTDRGAGLALRAAYGFSPLFSAYLELGGSGLDDNGETYSVGHLDLGGEFTFLPTGTVKPFVGVALTGTVATFDVRGTDVDFRGGGLTLSGGVKILLSPNVHLRAALAAGGGRFNEVRGGGMTVDLDDVTYGNARLGVGVAYTF